ncbi:UNVERIFIED_CONTAM: hypothetical protein Sangu_2935200 [Sesamum angustifolium]|uniref:SWIM-type domain-containing protein n=1 Tax=Sesamum angustifolium TaxID=2727405 RepID=A0AAW2IL47_9LAMI
MSSLSHCRSLAKVRPVKPSLSKASSKRESDRAPNGVGERPCIYNELECTAVMQYTAYYKAAALIESCTAATLTCSAEQIHVEPPPTDEQQWGEMNPQMSQQWGEANPQMSNQWGEYMNLLATPGLPSCSNTDYLADEASEPDEAEYLIPPEDGPDRVDINVMTEIFTQRGVETSSEPALPDMNTQPTFYRSIPFFEQTFPEIPTDSVDVTNLRNQQVLPLAFAVVDEETYPSWKWFLQQLSRHVIRGRRGMCLISDRHGGLTKAVREGSDFVSPHGVHQYCLRHVCSNFNSTIKNVVLKDLCWQAGSEYQLRKFNRIMDEIKKQDVKALAYLDAINKEKWTASHDGGWRCGIFTTNMSECINGVLKGARRLPVSALVEITLERTVHYFHVRAIKGKKMLQNNQLWTDFACKMFISWQQKVVEHTVTKYSHAQQSTSVVTRRQGRHGMNTHVVKIANQECSCGKWNQFGIPCSHAQKICGAYNISAASMVKDYYDVMAYNNTYSKHFEPVQ